MGQRVIVHLIRHEKTAANMARRYIGWTDEPIMTTPKPIANLQPHIVYGSDLMRCVQTAQGYFPQASYYANAQLRELNFGDFERKTYEQLQHNPIYRAWIDDPTAVTPPNGESFLSFEQRVDGAFREIITAPSSYTFVVHGGVIRVLAALYGKEQEFSNIMAKHETIYTLSWETWHDFKGGTRCTSYSEVPITAKERM